MAPHGGNYVPCTTSNGMNTFFKIAQIVIPPPPVQGKGFTLGELANLIAAVGSFLTGIAAIFAMIAIIVSGIMYMKAGSSDTEITKAKGWFKNAIIGAFIVLAVGVILNTIANVISRDFFCTFAIPFVHICVLKP